MSDPYATLRWLVLCLAVTAAPLGGCTSNIPLQAAPPEEIPRFPWPPPQASAEAEIPANWLPVAGSATHLADVAKKLEDALRAAKYKKWTYSSVPNGFALVTQMEQIQSDGTPSPAQARWSADLPSVGQLTLLEFIKALAGAPRGYYRVIVFIVTDQPWTRTGETPTGEAAQRWLAEGFNRLPASIGNLPYGQGYETTALVYEFEKRSERSDATLVENSDARNHLRKAGISDPLSGWR